jgi:hypothetical protein
MLWQIKQRMKIPLNLMKIFSERFEHFEKKKLKKLKNYVI